MTKKEPKILSKEDRIKREKSRLSRIFTHIDDKAKKAACERINNAAFIGVILQDLQESIKNKDRNNKILNDNFL